MPFERSALLRVFSGTCLLAGSLLLAAVPAPANGVSGAEPAPRLQPIIAATPSEVSFSSVPVGSRYSQAIRLTNLSASLKTINTVTATGAGLALERFFAPLVLGPGESVTITVDYRPVNAGAALGKVTVGVKDEVPTEIVVRESAQGRSKDGEITVQGDLDFGKVPIGTTATKALTLRNNGKSGVQIGDTAFADSSFSAVNSWAGTLAPGQEVQFEVQFSPATLGIRSAAATIGKGSNAGTLQIEASGEGVSASDHKIELNWQPSDVPVQGYFVYRAVEKDGPYTKLNASPVTQPAYTDDTAAAGQEYFYRVTSVDELGAESPFSAPMPMQAP